jgi:hypothetical protein
MDARLTEEVIDALRDGKPPPIGSLAGRRGSAPQSGKTTLTETPQPPELQAALREEAAPEPAGEATNAG